MATKKGGGSKGSGAPPPPARHAPAPAPSAPRARPQLRPIGGAKAPLVRPPATHAPTVTRAPLTLPSARSDTIVDREDATEVMDLARLGSEERAPSTAGEAKPPEPTRPATKTAAQAAPRAAKPARPNIDVVPPSERTQVMPERPVRPPEGPTRKPAIGFGGIAFPPPTARLPRNERLPSSPPGPMPAPPVVDETVVMPRGNLTPAPPPVGQPRRASARPIANVGPSHYPPAPPIANVGPSHYPPAPPIANVGPSHYPPAPPAVAPLASAPPSALRPVVSVRPPIALPASQPGIIGLVLYAAPLALATAAVAALALL